MICPNCKKEAEDMSLFCGNCGYNFSDKTQAPDSQTVYVTPLSETTNGNPDIVKEELKFHVIVGITDTLLNLLVALWAFLPYFKVEGSYGSVQNGVSLLYHSLLYLMCMVTDSKCYGPDFPFPGIVLFIPILLVLLSEAIFSAAHQKRVLMKKYAFIIPIVFVALSCVFSIVIIWGLNECGSIFGMSYMATAAEIIFIILGIISIAFMVICSSMQKKLLSRQVNNN